jgi:hypothetical protein
MFKKIFILSSLLLLTFSAISQSFEGKITYQNKYKSKMPGASDEQLNSMMGNTQEFFIQKGNYRSSMNGTFLQWQLYISKDKKFYAKMANAETIYFSDATVREEEILKKELNKGVVDILGYKCDELIITTKTTVQKYYFNPEIKIDPLDFKDHKYSNWDEIVSILKSQPLKFILDTPQFTLESVAIKIESQKVDPAMFVLPANASLQKSPF